MTEREWNIDDYRDKLYPTRGQKLSNCFVAHARQDLEDADVTDEMLFECYVFVAEIVRTHGEAFLPIFQRLHAEIETRKEKRSLLEAAIEVSKSNRPDPS